MIVISAEDHASCQWFRIPYKVALLGPAPLTLIDLYRMKFPRLYGDKGKPLTHCLYIFSKYSLAEMYFLYESEDTGHTFMRLEENDNPETMVLGKMSYFDPFIKQFMRETLNAGGTVQIALDQSKTANCVFIFDPFENTGTVFTKSKALFMQCIENVSNCNIFCELPDEIENEIFSILELDLLSSSLNHSFSNEITMLGKNEIEQIITAMSHIFPGMNLRWIGSALRNGDRCFASFSGTDVTGIGWCSITENIGHLISLGVLPRYRKLGIGTDLLYARLIWMKELGVSKVFSEISDNNTPSRKIADKAGFLETGKIYLYRIR